VSVIDEKIDMLGSEVACLYLTEVGRRDNHFVVGGIRSNNLIRVELGVWLASELDMLDC
jgi:hypothetical protein